jgi:hypothetical protein
MAQEQVAAKTELQDEYELLPEGHLRILELQPGKSEDPIACELKPGRLEQEENQYEAISYV